MTISLQPMTDTDTKAAWRIKATAVTIACAILPILLCSLLGWHFADILRQRIPLELTNIDAAAAMLSNTVAGSTHGDSWLPMMHALDTLHGPDRNRLYEKLFFDAHVRFQYPPTSLLPLHLLSTIGLLSVREIGRASCRERV